MLALSIREPYAELIGIRAARTGRNSARLA
jgi:hypothetical protein